MEFRNMAFPSSPPCARDRAQANNRLNTNDGHKSGEAGFGKQRKLLFFLKS
jgi:hypothetical protein